MSPQERREKGKQRWNSFRHHLHLSGVPLEKGKSFLDYGCGSGEVVYTAINNGFDAHGVEIDPSRLLTFSQVCGDDPRYAGKVVIYDGFMLPFESESFDYVYSWYVLEHVRDLWQGLREIVRVVKSGGVIGLHFADARNCIDMHVGIPWPPFLPRTLIGAYLDEWGLANSCKTMTEEVFYLTYPQVLSVLEFFHMEPLYKVDTAGGFYKRSLFIRTEDDARAVARELRELRDKGVWTEDHVNPCIYAKKMI